MLPVVCIFRAGLYVGLGAFGIATARSVSNGSFEGRAGAPTLLSGIPLGPCGLEFVNEFLDSASVLPPKSPAVGMAIGPPFIDAFEPLELGRVDVSVRPSRSLANLSARFSPVVEGASFMLGLAWDIARA